MNGSTEFQRKRQAIHSVAAKCSLISINKFGNRHFQNENHAVHSFKMLEDNWKKKIANICSTRNARSHSVTFPIGVRNNVKWETNTALMRLNSNCTMATKYHVFTINHRWEWASHWNFAAPKLCSTRAISNCGNWMVPNQLIELRLSDNKLNSPWQDFQR